ncbi:MAG: hypothetical protein JSR09_06390 [Bacteroidetes bacterium]|nr:hypothetical protein [Bacteroidota bacterium]MBS1649318.1 hypothetical protein [Bacteroidota bacterium]
MRQLYFIVFTVSILISCNSNKKQKAIQQTNTDTTAFFPVNDYLSNDIEDVQKTPYLIIKKVYENKILKDSIVINAKEFTALANIFLSKNITQPQLHSLYKPSLFNDLSTQSITFTYDALRDTLPVRSVMILLNDETNKLKNVFITSVNTSNNTIINERLTWNAGKNFSIHHDIKKENLPETIETTIVSWNDK